MILRKAELKDFEVYKKMFEDKEGLFHWIYYDESDSNMEEYNQEDFSDILKEYENYTLEEFEKNLKIDYIFMIEEYRQIVGYLRFFNTGTKGDYKIAEWAMINPNDDENKRTVIEWLLKTKLPRLRSFSICTPFERVGNFLLSNGFIQESAYFYKLKV